MREDLKNNIGNVPGYNPDKIAYIKPTDSKEAHRLGIIPSGINLPAGVTLYVLHAADGSVLGYTDEYASAWGAAIQNELTPVSLH